MKKVFFTMMIFAFIANVSAQLKVDAAGQVGIGTATPQYKLDVDGDIHVDGNIYLEGDSSFIATTSNVPLTFKVNGFLAGSTGASGKYNVSFGYRTLSSNTTGVYNTAAGYQALYSNTTGNSNTAAGYRALTSNTTGNYNTANGTYALYSNTTGIGNTAYGEKALYSNTTGNYNTANGINALYSNTTGSNNTADGMNALHSNTTGNSNTASGMSALYNNTTGSSNTVYGANALNYNTTGHGNAAYGNGALFFNTTGSFNTAIGNYADGSSDNLNHATAIGYDATATSSYQVKIGSSSITSIGGYAGWTNFSDKRAKKNIRTDVPGLAFINRLQPVTFNLDLDAIDGLLKIDKTKRPHEEELSPELIAINQKAREAKEKVIQTGFIAQDVEEIAKSIGYDFSGVDVDEKGIYGLRYAEFVVPLVKAVQELSEQNERLEALVNSLLEKDADPDLLKSRNAAESATGLQDAASAGASLQQNSPNPFNQSTQIKYYLPATVKTAYLCIYDLQGAQLKQTAIRGGEGVYTLYGSELKAGIYFYTLIADGREVDTKRMILTK